MVAIVCLCFSDEDESLAQTLNNNIIDASTVHDSKHAYTCRAKHFEHMS